MVGGVALLAVAAVSYPLAQLQCGGVGAQIVCAPLRRAPAAVMAGFGVSGGCAEVTCAPLRRASAALMAGFGASKTDTSSKSKKGKGKGKGKSGSGGSSKALSPKRQWDIFNDIVKHGTAATPVFAQLPGERWFDVGFVVAEEPGTNIEAAVMHKRLILEHAVRCYPQLTAKRNELVCGIGLGGADAEPEVLTSRDMREGLRAGFEGKPDRASGYYVTYNAASDSFTGSAKKAGIGGF